MYNYFEELYYKPISKLTKRKTKSRKWHTYQMHSKTEGRVEGLLHNKGLFWRFISLLNRNFNWENYGKSSPDSEISENSKKYKTMLRKKIIEIVVN